MKLKRYSYPLVFGSSSWSPLSSPTYDDVVDKSEFRPDSDVVRSALSSGTISGVGEYDFKDGKIPQGYEPSQVILDLRNGRLDKADVQKIKESLDKDIAVETAKETERKELEKADKILKARQTHLDKISGFDSSTVE